MSEPTPDKELDLIKNAYLTSNKLPNWQEMKQAIKEWSCRQRGCEPAKIQVDGESLLGLEWWKNGPCIHCGKEAE